MPITAPRAGGDQLKPSEIVGHLLLVRPTEWCPDTPTRDYGDSDAIRVDVCDFSGTTERPNVPIVYRDVLWFNKMLLGLRRQIGETTLGWMTTGVAKGKQDPPFQLEDATGNGEAMKLATAWLDAHPEFEGKPKVQAPAHEATPAPQGNGFTVPSASVATQGTATTPGPVTMTVPSAATPTGELTEEAKAALRAIGFPV
jgi:hypothetical protein